MYKFLRLLWRWGWRLARRLFRRRDRDPRQTGGQRFPLLWRLVGLWRAVTPPLDAIGLAAGSALGAALAPDPVSGAPQPNRFGLWIGANVAFTLIAAGLSAWPAAGALALGLACAHAAILIGGLRAYAEERAVLGGFVPVAHESGVDRRRYRDAALLKRKAVLLGSFVLFLAGSSTCLHAWFLDDPFLFPDLGFWGSMRAQIGFFVAHSLSTPGIDLIAGALAGASPFAPLGGGWLARNLLHALTLAILLGGAVLLLGRVGLIRGVLRALGDPEGAPGGGELLSRRVALAPAEFQRDLVRAALDAPAAVDRRRAAAAVARLGLIGYVRPFLAQIDDESDEEAKRAGLDACLALLADRSEGLGPDAPPVRARLAALEGWTARQSPAVRDRLQAMAAAV